MKEIKNLLKKLDESGKIELVGDLRFKLLDSYFRFEFNKYGVLCDICEREIGNCYMLIVDGEPSNFQICEECLKRNLKIENFDEFSKILIEFS